MNQEDPGFTNSGGSQGPIPQATATPTKLQLHYLELLERLQQVKYAYQDDPKREEWILQAIHKASYSAFRSCVQHGAEEWAKSILAKRQTED